MSISKPKNESRRLQVLWQYQVLDTVPEKVFDDLTDLAATICEAPIALISLVDEKRQWFKARIGISVSETSRDISFCAQAILKSEVMVVPDATKDPRFKNNPLVTGKEQIRFYAGAPLLTPDGYALGTLCVLDKKPRQLRKAQKESLAALARHVVAQLEMRRQARELAELREKHAHEHDELSEARAEVANLRAELARVSKKAKRVKTDCCG